MLDRITSVASVLRATQSLPFPTARTYAQVAVEASDNHTATAIARFHAAVAEAHRDGASSNDIVQMLDGWFVAQGLPTVIYA